MQTKKLLGSTLALGMAFSGSSASAAEMMKNLKFGGQIDLQAISANNVEDFATRPTDVIGEENQDHIGDAQTRIMVHADWDVLEDVHAKVSVTKNDRTWGTDGGNPQNDPNSQPLSSDAGNGILDNIFVDQANVKIDKVGGMVDVTAGRQFYGTSGDMIIYFGPSDKMLYGMPVSAIDAARFDWMGDWGGLTGIAGKAQGHALGTVSAGDDGDIDVRGLVATIKGTDMLGGGAYVYEVLSHRTDGSGVQPSESSQGGRNDRLWVAGLKAKATMGMAWLSAEFAKNFGKNRGEGDTEHLPSRSYKGWAAMANAGAKMETGIGAVSPWVHMGFGTGDNDSRSSSNNGFQAVNGDYRPGTIYGTFANGSPAELGGAYSSEFSGNGTLTNRFIWGLGVKTTPSAVNKLTAGLSYWDFQTQRSVTPVPSGEDRPLTGHRHIGSEVDLDLTWAHSENVTFGAGLARFWAGNAISRAVQEDAGGFGEESGVSPVCMAYGSVRIKFN